MRRRRRAGVAVRILCAALWVVAGTLAVGEESAAAGDAGDADVSLRDRFDVRCANWIYAGSKSSVCFSEKFLATLSEETNIRAARKLKPVKLSSPNVFEYPFAIMTGEGTFTLHEQERVNLKAYLSRGGFLLASAGCSSKAWARSFQAEMKKIFPKKEMKKIAMDHALFRTVYAVEAIKLKRGGTTLLEGLEMNGRIVLIYTSEGLNDTANVKGCCCCGGNEIKNSREINVNTFAYAVMH